LIYSETSRQKSDRKRYILVDATRVYARHSAKHERSDTMLSYKITSPAPETLNSIIIKLYSLKSDLGKLGNTDEELFTEALDRLEFLQERLNQKP
jgi:hypothetical protein